MGGPWRMPTSEEFGALFSLPYEFTTLNGMNGLLFTGKNGGKLFLPAAGDKAPIGGLADFNHLCCYWGSTGFSGYNYDGSTYMDGLHLWVGLPVRAVY